MTIRPKRWSPIAACMHTTGVSLTIATLLNTSRLETRQNGDRFVGLLVHHSNGSTDILGSWDPGDEEGISTVYSASNDGPLTGVAFNVTDFRKFYCVTDILPLTGSTIAPAGYRVLPVTVSSLENHANFVSKMNNPGLLTTHGDRRMVVQPPLR